MVNMTVCKLCGNPSSDFIFSVRQYDVLACKECGLFYINPYPEESGAHSKVKEYSYDDIDIADAEKHYQATSMFLERSLNEFGMNAKMRRLCWMLDAAQAIYWNWSINIQVSDVSE